MACGSPVIATNYSGPTEYLTKDCGILLDPLGMEGIYDPVFFAGGRDGQWASIGKEQLKHAIKEMLCKEEEELAELGASACARAQNFTWDASAKKVIDAFKSWELE